MKLCPNFGFLVPFWASWRGVGRLGKKLLQPSVGQQGRRQDAEMIVICGVELGGSEKKFCSRQLDSRGAVRLPKFGRSSGVSKRSVRHGGWGSGKLQKF
jgi:hypothetical protein